MSRWGKPHKDQRNWKKCNEELVVRGEMLFDMNFADQWNLELKEMNHGKRGARYRFPNSFMMLMLMWKQYLDYRSLEGMARSMVKKRLIPCYGDFSTVWYRIHDMKPDLMVRGLGFADIGTDGTGMKTNNAGSYRITKYGDPDAKKRKHLVVIITADVKRKRIIGIESHIEGDGPSESETAGKHIKTAVMNGVKVNKFYGDGAFDTNDLFDLAHSIGARPVIKIRKNASTEYSRGSRHRRRAIRIYKEKGYDKWAHENSYGMRWPCTEGIFSAVKRRFGENCVSRSKEGLEAEGYQRLWVYDYLNQGAKERVKAMN